MYIVWSSIVVLPFYFVWSIVVVSSRMRARELLSERHTRLYSRFLG